MAAKLTLVVEMKNGEVVGMRQWINGDRVTLVGDRPDKRNVRAIAGNYLGWGPIPPIEEWNWHHSWAPADHPANDVSGRVGAEEVGKLRHEIKRRRKEEALEREEINVVSSDTGEVTTFRPRADLLAFYTAEFERTGLDSDGDEHTAENFHREFGEQDISEEEEKLAATAAAMLWIAEHRKPEEVT